MVLIERLEPVLQEVTTYLIICMLALQSALCSKTNYIAVGTWVQIFLTIQVHECRLNINPLL